jgi:hypothetical protein
LKLSCSFNVLETSSAVTSRLKLETNSALVLSGFLMTSSDRELLTLMQSSLRCLTFLVAGITIGCVLVAFFFLYVTVLNPSRSGTRTDPEGEIPDAVTSLYDSSVKAVAVGVGAAGNASVERAAAGTGST